jgi:ankyrin repeat protein
MLIESGADVNSKNVDAATPIVFAAENAPASIVTILLDRGADPTIATRSGWTVFHGAALNKDREVLDVFQKSTVDVDNRSDENGWSPLHVASWAGNHGAVDFFLQQGVSVHLVNNLGNSALHLAAEGGHSDVSMRLIDGGADVLQANELGNTPIDNAKKFGHSKLANDMIEAAERALKPES